MKKICSSIVLTLLVLVLAVFFLRSPITSIPLTDLDREQVINVKISYPGISGINFLIHGDFQGKASMKFDGQLYEIPNGKSVALKIGQDWYENQAQIEYIPVDSPMGQLTLDYQFQTYQSALLPDWLKPKLHKDN